jgi:AraC family transcriptional regulator, regulatory protein of adaptative response / methylated-DNA-[protein]-cysteine methyltransferase
MRPGSLTCAPGKTFAVRLNYPPAEFEVHSPVEPELSVSYNMCLVFLHCAHRLMSNPRLPPHSEMVRAMLERDRSYDGVFFTAVRTTGIFCRPVCPARKPYPQNVFFYATAGEAMAAGFRPCQRCLPLEANVTPQWVRSLLEEAEATPDQRWTDNRLRAHGVEPVRVRRWFKQEFGMTFHSYLRTRRLGMALDRLASGDSIDDAALQIGYESVSAFRDAFQNTFGATPGKIAALKPLDFTRLETPLGPMIGMAERRGLVLLEFVDRPAMPREVEELRARYGYHVRPGTNPHLDQIQAELREYFLGQRREFTVSLVTPGGAFESAVWQQLQSVPFGVTSSYGELAKRLGKPRAARAVGAANGRNRIAIVIPCHRICGANGDLVDYGGGRARKQWLLDHERRIAGYAMQTTFLSMESAST